MSAAEPLAGPAPRRRVPPYLPSFLALALALGIVGGALVHVLRRAGARELALPELHGQLTWPAGRRPAPGLPALRRLRGRTAVLELVGPRCEGCAALRAELADVLRRLPAAERPGVVLARGARAQAPLVYLIDRRGDERTGYLFPFAPAFVEADLRTLARERLR